MPSLAETIAFLEASKYFLLFAGSYMEGTVVMLTAGLLWHLGDVDFWPAYLALMLGDFLSDLMWYFIGYFGARKLVMRWGHLIGATKPVIDKIERKFHTYHLRILIFSKLTMGFGLAVPILVTAGMMRVSLTRYIVINLLAGVVWIFGVMVVGYYFGNVLDLIPKEFEIIGAIAIIVGFFFGVKLLTSKLANSKW